MRSRRTSWTVVASAAGLLTLTAAAQDAETRPRSVEARSGAEERSDVDEVVVRGRRMSEIENELHVQAMEFVGEIATSPPGRGYARWNRRVCIGVTNLERTAAQYVVDRISLLATEVGLTPGEPGCQPGVMVFFTTDGRQLAGQLVQNQPLLFRPGVGQCCVNLSRAALDQFARSDRAVRWWHVSMPVDARSGEPAITLSGNRRPDGSNHRIISVAGPSLIHSGIRDEMRRVVIVVDSTKLAGVTWQALGDFLAVVALVQIDPSAGPSSFDSILNLFSGPAASTGLTEWDRSYVQAVYAFDQERRPDMQAREVVNRMVRQALDGD